MAHNQMALSRSLIERGGESISLSESCITGRRVEREERRKREKRGKGFDLMLLHTLGDNPSM